MDQISEAYSPSSLQGRANIYSYKKKKNCKVFQHFHHWFTCHVRLSLLLRLKTAPAQTNLFQYYFCEGVVIFIFTSKSFWAPGHLVAAQLHSRFWSYFGSLDSMGRVTIMEWRWFKIVSVVLSLWWEPTQLQRSQGQLQDKQGRKWKDVLN